MKFLPRQMFFLHIFVHSEKYVCDSLRIQRNMIALTIFHLIRAKSKENFTPRRKTLNDMIILTVTVFLLSMSQMEIIIIIWAKWNSVRLHKQKKNYQFNHIPFNLKRIKIYFPECRKADHLSWWKFHFWFRNETRTYAHMHGNVCM